MRAALLLLAALLLAGCSSPSPSPASVTPATASPATVVPAAAANVTAPEPPAAPLRVHLQPDLTMRGTPPATEGSVPLTTPVNSPSTTGYPTWKGTLAAPARLEKEIHVVLYAQASSASASGRNVPAMGFHQVDVRIGLGNLTFEGEAEGPDVILMGDVAKFTATIPVPHATVLPAGTPVTLDEIVYYSHVTGAAEFRFVMGPEHPSGFGVGSFPEGH